MLNVLYSCEAAKSQNLSSVFEKNHVSRFTLLCKNDNQSVFKMHMPSKSFISNIKDYYCINIHLVSIFGISD